VLGRIIPETYRIELVLFGTHNKKLSLYLAPMHRILTPVMGQEQLLAPGKIVVLLSPPFLIDRQPFEGLWAPQVCFGSWFYLLLAPSSLEACMLPSHSSSYSSKSTVGAVTA
jgi:hypothetical protein